MFGRKQRTHKADQMFRDWWDIHNHILPGLDDGSGSIDETIELIRDEHEQGVRHIIFTPHFRPGMFTVDASERMETFRSVKEIVQELFGDMTFYLGCEVHVHKDILQTLKEPACRMKAELAVLLEYSTNGSFRDLENVLERMVAEGYQPVLAHAERYRCLYEDRSCPARIKQTGTLIQINAGTFLEGRRSPRQKFADDLMQQGLVDFVASDAHDMKYRRVCIAECARQISRQYGKEAADRVFRLNQEKAFT